MRARAGSVYVCLHNRPSPPPPCLAKCRAPARAVCVCVWRERAASFYREEGTWIDDGVYRGERLGRENAMGCMMVVGGEKRK